MLYGYAYGVKRTKRRGAFLGLGGEEGAKDGFLKEVPLELNSERFFSLVRGRGNSREG